MLVQILSFAGASLLLYSTFAKTKHNILLIQCGDCAFNASACFLVGSYSAVVTNVLSLIRNLINIGNGNKKVVSAIFAALLLMIGVLVNRNGIIGLLPSIASVEYTLWMCYAKTARTLKAGLLINVSMWLIHDFAMGLYPAMTADAVIGISCLWNIIKEGEKQ